LPTATTSVLGGVKIDGTTITLNGSSQLVANYTLPTASTSVSGGIKIDGSTLAFNGNGQLYYTGAGAGGYTLPTATTSVLGGVKVDGSTITINGSGIISSTASGGAFSGLSDASSAGLTVDKVYLPAITRLNVTNRLTAAYLFDQYTGDNPTIYAISGTTIAFNLQATGHPFLIQTPGGTNYNTGLIHVSTAGVVSTGSSAQGQTSGTLYWKVPYDISGGYRYQCSAHVGMVGSLTVKSFAGL
jgi:plastocyanin